MEYGSDGLSYCSSCVFYGLNKQCWKCGMYLPASELQQYRGQWICPICIQDLRAKDRKETEYVHTKPKLQRITYSETCERCGKNLDTVYIWNGRRLCKSCLGAEQETWGLVGGGPSGAAQRLPVRPLRVQKQTSLIELIIGEFLALFGIKQTRQSEIIEVHSKMPISHAKPMTEGRIKKKSDLQKGEVEGIIKTKKKKQDMKIESEGLSKKKSKKKTKKKK
ncbi:hypothetical protein KKE38_03775 [Candidatus Micrarchaeota archaeon]|nr:hypothetical protein [Candidatus Micrarchaeota archaeon]